MRGGRWMLAGAGTVAALGAGAWGVGTSLPVTHTASVSADLAAPDTVVWRALTDVEAFPEWRPDVDAVEALPDRDGLPAWRERGPSGSLLLEVGAFEPPRRMVARVRDPGGAFGGTWTYVVASRRDGSRLTITEDGEVYSPLFRFVGRFILGHERTMRSYVEALERHLETAVPQGRGPEAGP